MNFDIGLFRKRTIETVTWCSFALAVEKTPADALRTVVAKPDEAELLNFSHDEMQAFIENVFAARSRALTQTLSLDEVVARYTQGRLLACSWYYDFNDGSAEHESYGYFDYGGFPPYDTWIYYEPSDAPKDTCHIIAWVPPAYLKLAEDGMAFSTGRSSVWIEDYEHVNYKYVLTNFEYKLRHG